MKRYFIPILALVIVLLFSVQTSMSGDYAISAHGDSSIGVKRELTNSVSIYTRGHCAHCHEQHASVKGGEPAPSGGPSEFCLLANNYTPGATSPYSETDNVCFYCHSSSGSLQDGEITNDDYSATFGGSLPNVTGIMDAFNLGANILSYHNLNDIYLYITGSQGSKSFDNFPADSNPCSGCHNVHIAKRNKANPGDPAYTAISKPSDHANLWGDDDGSVNPSERMNAYTSNYQAPYWYGSTDYFEPYSTNTDTDGSNLPDYVTFCTDCHNSTNIIYSTNLGRNLKTIDWDTEKHGKGLATDWITVDSPYASGTGSSGYVLSCLDCHEPHGSPNAFLIRGEVNGGALGGNIASFSDIDWHYLCNRCHQDDIELRPSACKADQYAVIHHESIAGVNEDPFRPSPGSCGSCHSPAFTPETNVLMSDKICKPIGEIKTGDKILSFDFDNNAPRKSEVVEASNHVVRETIEINGVKTTHEQLFAVGKDRWVRADQLKTGDTVLGIGHLGSLEKIKLERPVYSKHPKGVEVTEITIKDTQNFFVIGKGKSKFLVHNPPYSCTNTGYKMVCTGCHYHGSIYSTWRTF